MNCDNHPKKYAVGKCESCGKAVCIECAFEFDKYYYCTSCVQKRHNKKSESKSEKRKNVDLITEWMNLRYGNL